MLIINGVAYVEGKLVRACVRTEAGRITEIGELTPAPGERTMDAQGRYLLPGFVDVHIHGYAGHDTMQGEAAVRAMARGLGEQGVAAFLATTMSAGIADTRAALLGVKAAMHRSSEGARVVGAHMEAPFMNGKHAGAQLPEHFLAPDMAAYDRMTEGAADIVRLITLAPELDGAEAFVRAITARGVRVSAGHSDATAEQLHTAADWGATQVTHLFNAHTPLHHRLPGIPGAALTDPRVAVQVIADLIHLHPDAVRLAIAAKRGCACGCGVLLITDAMEAAGMPDGQYELGGQCVYVQGGAARLKAGNLAGSTLKMHEALRNTIVALGTPPEQAIEMATEAPARSIGVETHYGRIAAGCAARFALMDQDWQFIEAVTES